MKTSPTFTLMEPTESINYARIEQALGYLTEHFQRQPTLDEVAEKVHISPFHFQRIFTEWAGISPKRFLQYLTVNFLKEKLRESASIAEAADAAGLSSQSRVHDIFTTLEAVTPLEYKTSGSGIRVDYGFHETRFGTCLIGVTARGICWFSFLSDDEDATYALQSMKEHWHHSIFYENKSLTAATVEKIFPPAGDARQERLHLFVKGTNFQIKVWEALLKIPTGNVTTYQQVAAAIHKPKASQAVGSAVGSNHIALLIPCHRVIRKDGILGEYRWNSIRKKGIIGWEMGREERCRK